MIADLEVGGSKIGVDIAAAVIDAISEESTTGVSTLTVQVSDPDLKILASGIFAKKTPATYQGQLLRVTGAVVDGDIATVTVTLSQRGVWDLQQERTDFAPGNPAADQLTDYSAYMAAAAERVGLRTHIQPPLQTGFSLVRISTPGSYESTWEVGGEGASEWGWWLFEGGGVLFFGTPTWLLATAPTVISVGWRGSAGTNRDALEVPKCTRVDAITTAGQDEASIIEVAVDAGRVSGVHPGSALAFSGMPSFAGRYLVTQVVRKPGSVEPARITAVTAIDPFVDVTAIDAAGSEAAQLPHVENTAGPWGGTALDALLAAARTANVRWPFIRTIEKACRLPDYLLFAVGMKETGLRNEISAPQTNREGKVGHGHGVWQLDDRSHAIPPGFDGDVQAQCEKAGAMMMSFIAQYDGDVERAADRYNGAQAGAQYGVDVVEMRQSLESNAGLWL